MGESLSTAERLKVRAGLGFVQVLRPALYGLLVLSALFTFWAGGEVAGKALPEWTQRVAPTIFGIFIVIFAVYRLALVRAKKYPAATGLFQIGLGALIWVMLLPSTRQKIAPPPGTTDDVAALMSSGDARVRALAAEVAGSRGPKYASQLIDKLDDGDATVRQRARASLARLFGTDVGDSQDAWRTLLRQRGW